MKLISIDVKSGVCVSESLIREIAYPEWDEYDQQLENRIQAETDTEFTAPSFYEIQAEVDLMHNDLEKRELAHSAGIDLLTGLPNRKTLFEQIQAEIREVNHFGLAYIDLDHFKAVNDKMGHDVGDSVLKLYARKLHATIRSKSKHSGDDVDVQVSRDPDLPTRFRGGPHWDGEVARLYGDEFVILLRNVDELGLQEVASRLASVTVDETDLKELEGLETVQGSVGTVVYRKETPVELVRKAEAAMYADKKARQTQTIDLTHEVEIDKS